MPAINVNPTRQELTRLKTRLRTSIRGHKLLKDKRDELMKQFMDVVRENRALRKRVEEGLMRAHGSFTVASALMSTEMLEQALSHSLVIYVALDGDAVVGLIRLIGDGFSSIFVQDLIVLPSYQRQGIGSDLMKEALGDFKDAYQVQLVTDQTEKTLGFYRSLGFETLSTYDCTGMIWVDRKR